MTTLHVLIAGRLAGKVAQGKGGSLSFSYDTDYAGPPLSISMPVANRTAGDKLVRPYLFGLLPDSLEVRCSVGRQWGVSGNNPLALLAHIGRDCPGAVQLCCEEDLETTLQEDGALDKITESQIAERLALGRQDREASWVEENEHWSIGGQQSKFALRLKDDEWYRCLGSSATTHILKPGISHLKLEALNEYVCMKAAAACGIATSHVDYRLFCSEPAIVITRYDRVVETDGIVRRLHQEDLCQALGVLPENKYTENGGPGALDVINLLKKTGEPSSANVRAFMKMLFFNYLIGAPDAHAKNYSILLDCDAAFLAPLYDAASAVPYTKRPGDIKLAMGIAGENRVGMLSAKRIEKFAKAARTDELGLSAQDLVSQLACLCEKVPRAFEKVLSENAQVSGVEELAGRLAPGVTALCEQSLSRL